MRYPLGRIHARPIPILMYHKFPQDSLKQHVQWICDNKYIPSHLNEVKKYLVSPQQTPFPDRRLVLTFDDALKDFFDNAYPLLKEFDFPATICVPVGYVSHGATVRKVDNWANNETSTNQIMTWDELKELAGNPLFEIIPHSATHIPFDSDTIEKDECKLECEIGRSKAVLQERLELTTVEFFCFPGGAGWGKPKPEKVLERHNYVGALRAEYNNGEGWNRYCIPRWDIGTQTIESVLKSIADYC